MTSYTQTFSLSETGTLSLFKMNNPRAKIASETSSPGLTKFVSATKQVSETSTAKIIKALSKALATIREATLAQQKHPATHVKALSIGESNSPNLSWVHKFVKFLSVTESSGLSLSRSIVKSVMFVESEGLSDLSLSRIISFILPIFGETEVPIIFKALSRALPTSESSALSLTKSTHLGTTRLPIVAEGTSPSLSWHKTWSWVLSAIETSVISIGRFISKEVFFGEKAAIVGSFWTQFLQDGAFPFLLSNLNQTALKTTNSGEMVFGSTGVGPSTGNGKFYVEFQIGTASTSVAPPQVGWTDAYWYGFPLSDQYSFGVDPGGYVYFATDANVTYTAPLSTGLTYALGDNVSMAVDWTTMLMWYRINGGHWNGNAMADPVAEIDGINIAMIGPGPYYPFAARIRPYSSVTANFSNSSTYPTPASYQPVNGLYLVIPHNPFP